MMSNTEPPSEYVPREPEWPSESVVDPDTGISYFPDGSDDPEPEYDPDDLLVEPPDDTPVWCSEHMEPYCPRHTEPPSEPKGCRHIELPDTLWKRLREAEEKAEEEYRRGFNEGVRRLDNLRREQGDAAPEPPSGGGVTAGELAGLLWESVDDKGIRGRLFRDDCDYLVAAILARHDVRRKP